MIDATRILDMLVGGGQAGSARGRTRLQRRTAIHKRARNKPAGAGDLLERARGMLGGVPNGFGGGMAGGVAAGAITSLLLGSKGGREFAGEALKLGAAAALGGLAYRAYSNYRSGSPLAPIRRARRSPSVRPSPLPAATPASEHALLLVRAMIAAALSDGALDATERERIVGRLAAAGIDSEEVRFLDGEIARPWSPGQFAAAAPNPEQRAEIYLASALAIDADTDTERAYLRYLAATLALDDKLIAHLDDAVRGAKIGAPHRSKSWPPASGTGRGGRSRCAAGMRNRPRSPENEDIRPRRSGRRCPRPYRFRRARAGSRFWQRSQRFEEPGTGPEREQRRRSGRRQPGLCLAGPDRAAEAGRPL